MNLGGLFCADHVDVRLRFSVKIRCIVIRYGCQEQNSPKRLSEVLDSPASLKASAKKDHLRVDVTGDVQGDTLKVTSIKLL